MFNSLRQKRDPKPEKPSQPEASTASTALATLDPQDPQGAQGVQGALAQLLADAHNALKKGHTDVAEKRFTEAMELDTTCSEARYHLGCLYFQRHETEHAEHQWLKAIEHNPLEKGAYNALASLYFKQGQAKKALRYWKQFIYLRPTDALAHYNVGLVYQKLGMMRDSNQYMKQFMALKPHCPEAKELRAHYQQSIEVAHHNLKQAELHLQQGRLKKAREAYAASFGLVPLHYKMYLHYGNVLYKLQAWDEAVAVYREGLREAPDNPNMLINYAVACEKTNDLFQTLWALTKVISLYPNNAPAKVRQHYSTVWKQTGTRSMDDKLKEAEALMKNDGHDAAEWLLVQITEVAMHACPDYLSVVSPAKDRLKLLRNPKKQAAANAFEKAEYHFMTRQWQGAKTHYKRYLDLVPDGPGALEARRKLAEIEDTLTYGELNTEIPRLKRHDDLTDDGPDGAAGADDSPAVA